MGDLNGSSGSGGKYDWEQKRIGTGGAVWQGQGTVPLAAVTNTIGNRKGQGQEGPFGKDRE